MARLLLALLLLSVQPVAAQEETLWQPFAAMALNNGYRLTVVQEADQLRFSWRPYDADVEASDLILTSEKGPLSPVPGSAQALLEETATVFVVLDPSEPKGLLDQLIALRAAFAHARFERQRWEVFLPQDLTNPLAVVADEADLESQWPKLRALLSTDAGSSPPSLSRLMANLAARKGDRKGLIVPQTLMQLLAPGLNDEGIAALQAFGISLYPLTYKLSPEAALAFDALAGPTGGQVLPWLDIPPSAEAASSAFLPLSLGGTAQFALPKPPWAPWETPAPLVATLAGPQQAYLSLIIPRQGAAWSGLPWPIIAGVAIGLLLAATAGLFLLSRVFAAPPQTVLVDMASQRRYPVTRWPAVVGRSAEADITIANANLRPQHFKLKAVASAVELSLVDAKAADLSIAGQAKTDQVLGTSTEFTAGGVAFKLELSP